MDKLDFTISKLGDQKIKSPLKNTGFLNKSSRVVYSSDPEELIAQYEKSGSMKAFEKAGPREMIFHDPAWSKAAILTAGGLCPGLNDVIKGLTITLQHRYKVPVIYGIRYGYAGLIPEFGYEPMLLTEENVDSIHCEGGTILGSSRGRQDEKIMVDTLVRMNINMLFCIGGDGTLRCAHDVAKEIKRRKLSISVVGIPKTIDNDVSFIDQTFGFETAVYATNSVITAAHNEAKGVINGIGLIHVMGRDSGFIAANATLANSHVNYCLVPEEEFSLDTGASNDLIKSLFERLRIRKHAVIIVAEGAGQYLFDKNEEVLDKSGNVLHRNIGLYLKAQLQKIAKKHEFDMNIKYFDPSYMIRSLPAHGTDAVFCLMLAQSAAHAAMAGFTDMVVGHWSDSFTNVPIALATKERKKIDPNGPLWRSVKAVTWPEF